jgi:hypothetical protein
MMSRRRFCACLLGMALTLCTLSVRAQSSGPSLDWISAEMLLEMGVHLPSYFLTVPDQMAYQAKVRLQQEITVAWSANAGPQQSEPGFVLVRRLQHIPQPVRKSVPAAQPKPTAHSMLVIATTPGGEVRGLAVCADNRSTTGQLAVRLPEDGQISKLMFLQVVPGAAPALVGQVAVGLPDSVPQAAKSKTPFATPQ